jgi:hypothetical protein
MADASVSVPFVHATIIERRARAQGAESVARGAESVARGSASGNGGGSRSVALLGLG